VSNVDQNFTVKFTGVFFNNIEPRNKEKST